MTTAATDQFDGPASANGIQWVELEGQLLLVTPHENATVTTAFGESMAVRADLVRLDGDGAPEEITDTLIFPKVLQGQVRRNVGTGRMNLGRLGKGVAKPGQSAPWMLADPTEQDRARARAYLAQKDAPPF